MEFWKNESQDPELSLPQLTIKAHSAEVIRFLSRLTSTAEYQNLATRPFLGKRVITAFQVMSQDQKIQERAVDLIFQGLASCDDRIISALEKVELMLLIDKIEKLPQTESSLKELGKGFFFLEEVNKKAAKYIETLPYVDEIEVYLAFQIGLADRFKLPFTTRHMIFRRMANISDEEITRFGDEIEREYSEARLNNYLRDWSPWIKHQRRSSAPKYETLPSCQRAEAENLCVISQAVPMQPVFYEKKVYDYEVFIQCYVENGIDPFTRKPIDLKGLLRIEPSLQ